MQIVPLTMAGANSFIAEHHRHHKPVHGLKFALGLKVEDQLIGVAVVGRPVARHSDDGATAEVTRLCTDGSYNACSKLYAACSRVAKEMGYRSIQTYILDSESGTSLKASGWKFVRHTAGGSWNRGSRTGRREDQPMCPKQLWNKELN